MATFNIVIEIVTGDAIRAGYCDFENDGSFDPATQAMRSDGPMEPKLKGAIGETLMTRWNGSIWVEVAQPPKPPQVAPISIIGLDVNTTSGSTFTIEVGQCRDSLDQSNLVVESQISGDIAVSGAGGLDTGSEAGDTWYAIFVITDSSLTNSPNTLLSVSATAPTMPTGYDLFRRVGWVRNNSGSLFVRFVTRGSANEKTAYYNVVASNSRPLTNGSATIFTVVDLSEFVPPTGHVVILNARFETNRSSPPASDNTARLRPNGFSQDNTVWRPSAGLNSKEKIAGQVTMPCDASQLIEYRVDSSTNRFTIEVGGYVDSV